MGNDMVPQGMLIRLVRQTLSAWVDAVDRLRGLGDLRLSVVETQGNLLVLDRLDPWAAGSARTAAGVCRSFEGTCGTVLALRGVPAWVLEATVSVQPVVRSLETALLGLRESN